MLVLFYKVLSFTSKHAKEVQTIPIKCDKRYIYDHQIDACLSKCCEFKSVFSSETFRVSSSKVRLLLEVIVTVKEHCASVFELSWTKA